MKKLLSLILVIAAFTMTASAQVTMTQTDPAGASASVNTNADTSYHKSDLPGQTFNYAYITITCIGTKTSGTISSGTAVPFGSLDGTNWFQIYDKDSVSSQNLTDGTTTLAWHFDTTRWRYYRIRVITAGTQVSSYVCKLLGRKVPN